MKYSLMVIALAVVITGCTSPATRDALQIQDQTILHSGFGTPQDSHSGAPSPEWLDMYRSVRSTPAEADLQRRLEALGPRKDNYFGYKAQCWIKAAQDERGHRDQWGFIEEALFEAGKLTAALESGQGLSADNPDLRTSSALRPDIWKDLLAAKSSPEFPSCTDAQRLTACAEVEMYRAGHEAWTRDFKGSKQIVDSLEKGLPDIGTALAACTPPPAAAPVVPEKITLQGDATFKFDRSDLAGMLPSGRAQLDGLIQNIKLTNDLTNIRIEGYTDHLGSDSYNRRLSTRRAETVKHYMQSGGVAVPMTALGMGKANPVVQCSDKNRHALIECLEPNRRVELNFMRRNSDVVPVDQSTSLQPVAPAAAVVEPVLAEPQQ
ncbi:OmpA family protein [Paraburkholderia bonniea]|uniref:OmpA family protein n=1 Tax=Paraburkholderia bonniea TaxID=2152891 RepID=UPI0012910400|nr:OmpA family protein [Paraburkholderia bonniea]WJF91755.1 OmpA family protein [Paraburkholderia bonniea]WJF95075.1 OmpA family protein [Paraburkholderia bonniea]